MGRGVLLCAVGWLLLGLQPAPAHAAEPAPDYRIGAGDLLNLEVVGRRDLSTQYSVGQDGVLFVPVIGGVPAEGKTTAELSAELGRRFSLYDRDISQVNISIAEFRSRKIYVLGAVLRPGKYSFAELPTVWDAISEAGGPTDDAQLSAVELIPSDASGGRTSQVLDVAAALKEGRLQSLERLKAGDTVRVPRGAGGTAPGPSSNSVYLFGAIARQGSLSIEKASDLMAAVIQSGGPNPDANLSRVQIVRRNGGRTLHMKVNLNDYLGKAMNTGNPPLLAGDTVYFPRLESTGILSKLRTYSPFLALASTVFAFTRRR